MNGNAPLYSELYGPEWAKKNLPHGEECCHVCPICGRDWSHFVPEQSSLDEWKQPCPTCLRVRVADCQRWVMRREKAQAVQHQSSRQVDEELGRDDEPHHITEATTDLGEGGSEGLQDLV